jgi:hypothetical protein
MDYFLTLGNFGEIFVDVGLTYYRSLLSTLGYVPEKVSVIGSEESIV